MQGAKVRTQGAKVRASISASRYGMQQQHATTTATTSDRIGPAQHDAAISATCVRTPISSTNLALTQVALIAASYCAGPIRSLVVVHVHTCAHGYFYTTTQQMPVATTRTHTVSGDRPVGLKPNSSHLS